MFKFALPMDVIRLRRSTWCLGLLGLTVAIASAYMIVQLVKVPDRISEEIEIAPMVFATINADSEDVRIKIENRSRQPVMVANPQGNLDIGLTPLVASVQSCGPKVFVGPVVSAGSTEEWTFSVESCWTVRP